MDDVYSDMKHMNGGSRLGDGNSHGSSSKHSDSMSDDNPPPPAAAGPSTSTATANGGTPYEVLMHDLTQAKRQLIELHNLVSQINTSLAKHALQLRF